MNEYTQKDWKVEIISGIYKLEEGLNMLEQQGYEIYQVNLSGLNFSVIAYRWKDSGESQKPSGYGEGGKPTYKSKEVDDGEFYGD